MCFLLRTPPRVTGNARGGGLGRGRVGFGRGVANTRGRGANTRGRGGFGRGSRGGSSIVPISRRGGNSGPQCAGIVLFLFVANLKGHSIIVYLLPRFLCRFW